MSLVIHCTNPACANSLQVKEELLGKRVRCPFCQQVLEVRQPAPEEELVLLDPEEEEGITAAPKPPPVPLLCPECNAEISPGAVRCGDCGFKLRSGQQRITKPPEDEEDRPRRKKGRQYEDDEEEVEKPRKKKGQKRQQFKLTNLGLSFHYAKVLCFLVGFLLNIVLAGLTGVFVGTVAAGRGVASAQTVGGMAAVLGILEIFVRSLVMGIAPLLGITGSILCCWVPPKSGARPLIISSLALDGVAILLSILMLLLKLVSALGGVSRGTAAASDMLYSLAVLCGVAAFVLFMLFLRLLARYLLEYELGTEAVQILIQLGMMVGAVILGAIAVTAVVIATRSPGIAVVLVVIGGIGLLVWEILILFRILNLIGSLRQILRTRTGA